MTKQNLKKMSEVQFNNKQRLEKLLKEGSISKTERAFLNSLETKLQIPIHRQVKFGKYLLDGKLAGYRICIEFDGKENHESQIKTEKDYNRDLLLLKAGFSIYRMQWFDFVDYSLWQKEVDKQAEIAQRVIKILIKLKQRVC